MNREELRNLLEKYQIKPGVYNIYGLKGYNPYGLQRVLADDQTVLDQENNKWVVYFYERGQKINPQSFSSEDEACQSFLNEILNDPTTRLNKQ
jgi:hypothetical protein